jgi:hypothetical protein
MPALHLGQSALVHINTLFVQAVLEIPEFHDLIGPDERVVAAFGYYLWGGTGRDSDTGAMLSSRTDERQSLLRMRAQALAAMAVAVTGVAGFTVAVAFRVPAWPFLPVLGVEVIAFIASLAICRARRPLGKLVPRRGTTARRDAVGGQ